MIPTPRIPFCFRAPVPLLTGRKAVSPQEPVEGPKAVPDSVGCRQNHRGLYQQVRAGLPSLTRSQPDYRLS